MKQYTENQYDDDLTVGTDDYDDSYYTGSVDLFEFSNDEESPISRLKSLILSIDWEITDEILMQFNEELVDLRDIWAGEKINLVYVQALEKISKYIYQKKADSHPSAIKLLLTLYHNLEKIVSSFDLSDEQKKEILLEDVKRFESLKHYIGKHSETIDESQTIQPKFTKETDNSFNENGLLNIKAIVLGIDWEITDNDLNQLRQEVVRLEEKFADSRPRLILLQGIGTLAAYIKLKKSNAHADAFKLLHLFYESLEKIVITPMTLEEEKAILFPAVEKFNSFKSLLGPTIAPEAIDRDEKETTEDDGPIGPLAVAPAFADIPEEDTRGFQAEEEAQSLGFESSGSVDNHVESFFLGTSFQRPEIAISSDSTGPANKENSDIALQGVDVGVDEEDAYDGVPSGSFNIAPALSTVSEGQLVEVEPSPAAFQDEDLVHIEDSIGLPAETFEDTFLDSAFADEVEEKAEFEFSKLDKDILLQGVDVETEADDDSDEEALPLLGGELAPALAGNDEVSIFNAEIFEKSSGTENIDDEIAGTLGGFFDEEIESHLSAPPKVEDVDLDITSIALDSVDDERGIGGYGESLSSFDTEHIGLEDLAQEVKIEEDILTPFAMEGATVPEGKPVSLSDVEQLVVIPETEDEDEAIAFVSELGQDESLNDFLDDSDFETSTEKRLEEGQEEKISEIDEQLDSFFDLGEGVDEPEEDKLIFTLPEETTENILSVEEDIVHPAPVPEFDDIERDEVEADEVVFELVEEVGQLSDTEPHHGKIEETSFDELLSVDEDMVSSVLITEEDDNTVEELPEKPPFTLGTDKSSGAYLSLNICVEALGVELDDKVITGLWKEIDQLYQDLTDKPLEKTFLQLLSTITRHIDQNRYDSSTDAYVLLQSVCRALTELQEDDLYQKQELLLTETQKVLRWQEDLLTEQAARDEAELTIGDAILTEQDSDLGAFDERLQNDREETTDENYDSDALGGEVDHQETAIEVTSGKVFDQGDSEEPTRLDEEQENISIGNDTKILTDDLKKEISTLRQTLQDEIAELRRELKGNYP